MDASRTDGGCSLGTRLKTGTGLGVPRCPGEEYLGRMGIGEAQTRHKKSDVLGRIKGGEPLLVGVFRSLNIEGEGDRPLSRASRVVGLRLCRSGNKKC